MSEKDIEQARGMNQALEDTIEEARIADIVQSRAYRSYALRPGGIDDTIPEGRQCLGGVIDFRRDGGRSLRGGKFGVFRGGGGGRQCSAWGFRLRTGWDGEWEEQ